MTVYIQKWTPFRYACALKSLQQGVNNVNGTTDPKNRQINRNALAASAIAQANAASPYALSNFVITGVAGQVSFTVPNGAGTLTVGQQVVIAGTFGGTGILIDTGYASPTTYVVSVTNGTTTATLTKVGGGALTSNGGHTRQALPKTVAACRGFVGYKLARRVYFTRTSTAGLMLNVPLVPGFVLRPSGTNDDGT